MAPVSGPSKGWRSWNSWGPGRGAPRGGGRGRTRLLREGPAGGTEARGRRPGARARRGLGPTRRPPPHRRGARAGPARPGPARPPHLAAAPSSSPGRRSWAATAAAGAAKRRRKEEGRGGRERRREKAEWPLRRRAPPGRGEGVRGRGSRARRGGRGRKR